MRESILRWFGHVVRRNNKDIVRKMGEMKVEENRGRGRPKEKRVEIIREDNRTWNRLV